MRKINVAIVFLFGVLSCKQSTLPLIKADVITEKVKYDTDDPAIWVNPENASESIVFGTDKNTDGAIYAFDLNGKVIEAKTIRNISRPNNVDLRYDFKLTDTTTTAIIAFTERERKQIRLFSVPDMMPLDNGGIPVFEGEMNEEWVLPMGVSLYKSFVDGTMYAIVGRKSGPKEGYLFQYKLEMDSLQNLQTTLVRKFGKFSGIKEIEAIAVDDENGFVYYSDEGQCIRKYHAEPSKGNEEISCFGGQDFTEDIEGIAIAQYPNGEGYIIVSDQQKGQFNVYSRKDNAFVKALNLGTLETDGCDVVTVSLNNTFKNGLFVAMNDEGNFYFYDLKRLGL